MERGDDAMRTRLGGDARSWAPHRLWPGSDDRAAHAGIFRELAAGDAPEGRKCLNGDNAACMQIAGISEQARRMNVRGSESVRRSVLRAALRAGGEGAYSRFASDSASSVVRLLEAASGLTGDSLISVWRAQVIAARPVPVSTPARTVMMAIAWGTVLCAISLRSSRWR
jgi:hypothetical protein